MQSEYDEYQARFRERYFCIGWRELDSQVKHYYAALFDSWSDANHISAGIQRDHPEYISFVDAVTETKTCPQCNGTSISVQTEDFCTHCHGRGIVRK